MFAKFLIFLLNTVYLSPQNYLEPGQIRKIYFQREASGYKKIFIKKDSKHKVDIDAEVETKTEKLVKRLLTSKTDTFEPTDFEDQVRNG